MKQVSAQCLDSLQSLRHTPFFRRPMSSKLPLSAAATATIHFAPLLPRRLSTTLLLERHRGNFSQASGRNKTASVCRHCHRLQTTAQAGRMYTVSQDWHKANSLPAHLSATIQAALGEGPDGSKIICLTTLTALQPITVPVRSSLPVKQLSHNLFPKVSLQDRAPIQQDKSSLFNPRRLKMTAMRRPHQAIGAGATLVPLLLH